MKKVLASSLKVGDKILPPARELSLWMRKACAQKGLPESALLLTVTDIRQGMPDKNGAWLVFVCDQTPEWIGDSKPFPFKFKTRPSTPWPKV
jgi:hypothetical protein